VWGLARLHAIAVDFQKSGAPARLDKSLKPTKYPDFMEKHPAITYQSNKVLGRLYRRVKGILDTSRGSLSSLHDTLVPDPSVDVAGWEEYRDEAEDVFRWYQHDVGELMHRHGIEHEGWAVCGLLISDFSSPRSRRANHDDTRNDLLRELAGLVARYRQHFWGLCCEGAQPLEQDSEPTPPRSLRDFWRMVRRDRAVEEAMKRRACAWYRGSIEILMAEFRGASEPRPPSRYGDPFSIAHAGDDDETAHHRRDGRKPEFGVHPLLIGVSFPWVIVDALCWVRGTSESV
jgi:hypothetical protein